MKFRYKAMPMPYKGKLLLVYLEDGYLLNDVFYSNNLLGKVYLTQRLYSFGMEYKDATSLLNGHSLVPVRILTR